MATIDTVLGPIDSSELGRTLPHEHVLVTSAGVGHVYPEFIDREATIDAGVAQLKEAYAEGVRSIVDVSTIDLGRDVGVLEEVSRRSGVHVVCATGSWLDIPRIFLTATPDALAELYIREIREGIEGTGIRAGIIKVANDIEGVTEGGELVLRAVARTHQATGVPISTHAWAPLRVGEAQVRIFEDEGVDLGRVYIGHSNDTTDMDYLEGLIDKGVWIGLDRFPAGNRPGTPDWRGRTETVKRLIDAGYADRIMLSHDWATTVTAVNEEIREERARANPDGYLFISRNVVPMLTELGVGAEVIDQVMVDNPRRFFEG